MSACGLSRTDLVIILDASTSVTEANFKKQLGFVKTIIEYADIDSGRNIFYYSKTCVKRTLKRR